MIPDGIFEAALGVQELHAQVMNTSGATAVNTEVYLESVSHPGIVPTPATHTLDGLQPNAARVVQWIVDMSAAPPGEHLISFVSNSPGGLTRVIKKIFVSRTTFDPSSSTFVVDIPQGRLNIEFVDWIGSERPCCLPDKPSNRDDVQRATSVLGEGGTSFLDLARLLYTEKDTEFLFCLPGFLPHRIRVTLTPTPAYSGQYGDLPFQDPWWKIALLILAALLIIAAAIVAAATGSGSITPQAGGTFDDNPPNVNCCEPRARGGSDSYVVAGLVAAAAAAATAAGMSDERDPTRRGEDATPPAAGEFTVSESLDVTLLPKNAVALGRPFDVDVTWDYERITSGNTYTHNVSETNTNVHVLSRYPINAPDVVRAYRGERFVVEGEFFDADGKKLRGDQLFVQCFLSGPNGEARRFRLQDDGVRPDREPNDGVYTGEISFDPIKEKGLWTFFVIAQDVNNAQPNMDPEEAAKIIGGMVVTHQLTIAMGGGTCPLVPDGDVQVL
jgi:hypothetical protein